jgi:hypothetical protein
MPICQRRMRARSDVDIDCQFICFPPNWPCARFSVAGSVRGERLVIDVGPAPLQDATIRARVKFDNPPHWG